VRDDALDEAVASGLLAVDEETVRVRHPLVRSALYQAATDAQRRRVHLALADSLAAYNDFDRETWHRSAAAEGADQELADAIAHVGARAERRGGPAAALAAYERAATLATSELRRAELRLAAARTAWAAGQAARSRDLLSQINHQAADPLLLADAARLRGRIEVAVGSAEAAHRIFVEAVAALGEIDPSRSLELAVAAALLASYGADSGAELRLDAGLLEAATDGSARSTCLEQLFFAMTRTAEQDWSGAVAALDLAAAAGATVTDPDVLSNLGNAALQLGDDAVQQHFYGRGLSLARGAGAVTTVVYDLQRLCFGHLVAGDLTAVRACAEEAVALGDSVRARALTVPSLAWLALLDALQGLDDDERRARELDEVAGQSLGILQDPVHDLVSWAKGSRALGGSEPDHALHHFRQIRLPAITRMAALETIDAAARAGEPDVIRGLVEDLADFAQTTRRPWALATVAHGRAMIAGPAEAGALFDQALSHHRDSTRSLDRARTHLAYGEWLRRAQRRVDARTHLREALATFQDVRARPLDDRAASELRASGETARKRDPSTLLTLTPMELKVAQLVASGLSNKEVAAQCWVSPRTVGFHLRNVFAKAGISARGELARLDLG
jgi:DNA-binding CsgD family transcriptional regulator